MLQIWTLTKTRAETQLERAVGERTQMVREIEELRRQRDMLNRRIKFCKQKDSTGMTVRLVDTRCTFHEYMAEEIQAAKRAIRSLAEQTKMQNPNSRDLVPNRHHVVAAMSSLLHEKRVSAITAVKTLASVPNRIK
ncbi:hypothetical protein LR48_Vigan07g176300 [Vigna angularis]|uniref:Uncharacterized protein n=1 Tax=Phaseolus angularis TaxID=3914 RepID=A0A0L9UZV4_PHAAN|nr:hypothetical protein LR48_Vigan07g176300 [Vigna angularis]